MFLLHVLLFMSRHTVKKNLQHPIRFYLLNWLLLYYKTHWQAECVMLHSQEYDVVGFQLLLLSGSSITEWSKVFYRLLIQFALSCRVIWSWEGVHVRLKDTSAVPAEILHSVCTAAPGCKDRRQQLLTQIIILLVIFTLLIHELVSLCTACNWYIIILIISVPNAFETELYAGILVHFWTVWTGGDFVCHNIISDILLMWFEAPAASCTITVALQLNKVVHSRGVATPHVSLVRSLLFSSVLSCLLFILLALKKP